MAQLQGQKPPTDRAFGSAGPFGKHQLLIELDHRHGPGIPTDEEIDYHSAVPARVCRKPGRFMVVSAIDPDPVTDSQFA